MLVGNVMTPYVVACHAENTLERAAQLMWEHDVGFLPVVDGDDRVIGVITDRDALMAVYTRGLPLCLTGVGSTMSHFPVTCTIHEDARQIEHRMAEHQLRRLPVIDAAGKAIGVVTLSDIARASMRGHDLSSRGPTWALAAISASRHAPS